MVGRKVVSAPTQCSGEWASPMERAGHMLLILTTNPAKPQFTWA